MTERAPDPPIEMIRLETTTNQEAFQRLRAKCAQHEGEYALMKSGLIIDFFADRRAALVAGHERFADRLFSVHRIAPSDHRRDGAASAEDRHGTSPSVAPVTG